MDNGADVNAKNYYQQTPLHYAVSSGHAGAAKVLLDNGADVNAKDNLQRTPLHLATKNEDVDAAKILLYNGANIDTLKDNKIVKIALDSIEHDKMKQKMDILANLISEVYGMKPLDNLSMLDMIENILKYSPNNTNEMAKIKQHFETIGKTYF